MLRICSLLYELSTFYFINLFGYTTIMTKYTAMIFLGILVVVLPIIGLPSWVQTTLIVLSGIGIAVLAYLTSVVYCSNCKKLISDADNALAGHNDDKHVVTTVSASENTSNL